MTDGLDPPPNALASFVDATTPVVEAASPKLAWTGQALLLGAAGLAALLPAPSATAGSMWRIAPATAHRLLALGGSCARPLLLVALAALLIAGWLALRGTNSSVVDIGTVAVGMVVLAAIGVLWAGFLALLLVNFLVAVAIGVAYALAVLLLIAFFIGTLLGMLSGE